MVSGIKRDDPTHIPRASSTHLSGYFDRATKLFAATCETQRVQVDMIAAIAECS